MCLLGIPGHIPELERKLENIKNDFLKKTQDKRKNDLPYGHLLKSKKSKSRAYGQQIRKKRLKKEALKIK